VEELITNPEVSCLFRNWVTEQVNTEEDVERLSVTGDRNSISGM
jgi:hypothetical protein